MGVMLEANTNPEKRAELFLDRIRRGQFESLERYTTKDLREFGLAFRKMIHDGIAFQVL